MWYWRSPKSQSRLYFSTARAACEHLTAEAYGASQEKFTNYSFRDLIKAELIFIPEIPYSGVRQEVMKVPIQWKVGHAYPSIAIFAFERRDRNDSEAILGAK